MENLIAPQKQNGKKSVNGCLVDDYVSED